MKERVARSRGWSGGASGLGGAGDECRGGAGMAAARGTSSRREGPSVEKLGPSKAVPPRRKKVPVEPEYVGIDLHRRRSVIVRMSPDGERLSTEKIDNDPRSLAAAIAPAGPNPKVVVEATYGWYWAADVLEECGASSTGLAHPLGMKGIMSNRRVKNDVKDAVLLADLLRLGSLPEAWVAPPGLRELRGAGPLPGQARPDPQRVEGPGACGDGQGGCAAGASRHVRPGRPGPARRDAPGRLLPVADRLAPRSDQRVRRGDRCPRDPRPRPVEGPRRLPGRPGDRRGWAEVRGDLRGRDR